MMLVLVPASLPCLSDSGQYFSPSIVPIALGEGPVYNGLLWLSIIELRPMDVVFPTSRRSRGNFLLVAS